MEQTIPRLVQASGPAYADHSAVEDGNRRLTFAELAEAGIEAARAFIAAGVESGDRVAIWAPNIAEWIVAAIGLQSAGATLVTLSTRWKGAEAGFALRKSGAKLLCTLGDFLGMDYVAALADQDLPDLEHIIVLRGSVTGTTAWADFLKAGEKVPREQAVERLEAVAPDDVSDLIFTSGTTGQPKAVATMHHQNIRAFAAWSELTGLCPSDRYLIINPFFHSFGYKAGWLVCVMRGATAIPHAVFDVPEVLRRIGDENISVLPGAPTLYQSILAHPDLAKHDLSNLRLAVTGAAAIPVELIHRMRDELGFDTILTAYGLTETCGMVTMCRTDDDPETIANTSGRAIPDIEVQCVDTEGKEVNRGEPGEVVVRGYNVMRGYFDDEAETRKTIDTDGWLHTGDIGVMDARGYLRITDRIKDMYIVGGFNCYPAEIENLMFGSGQFAQVAVIGVPDERQGEVGMAFVIPAANTELSEASVITWCRDNMANYKVPRSVQIVEELPLNATGKVSKLELRDQARSLRS